MSRRNRGIQSTAEFILKKIDATMIDKLCRSTDMKKSAESKYLAITDARKKQDEGVKQILKSTLVNDDDNTYRIRLQQNGGFSITMVGNAFEKISLLKRNYRLQQFYYNGVFQVLPEEEKVLFLEKWNKIFQPDQNFNYSFYIVGKEDSLYIRCTNFGVTYHNGTYSSFSPLFDCIISGIDFVNTAKEVGNKLIELNGELQTFGGNLSNREVPTDLTFISADYVLSQMRQL